MDAGEGQRQGRAGFLPGDRRAQDQPRLERRHPERFREGRRRERGGAEQFRQLPARPGPPLAEGRRVALRPQAPARRHDGQHAPAGGEHPARPPRASRRGPASSPARGRAAPGRPRRRPAAGSSRRPARSCPPRGRPVDDTWRAGMKASERAASSAVEAEIGRAIAEAHHGHAARACPVAVDRPVDHAPGHLAQGLAVEGAQISTTSDTGPGTREKGTCRHCGRGGPRRQAGAPTLPRYHPRGAAPKAVPPPIPFQDEREGGGTTIAPGHGEIIANPSGRVR